MAIRKRDFVIQELGGSRVRVWGNASIKQLRELEGVVRVEDTKEYGYYVVWIDPRYDKDSVKDDIRALEKKEATNEQA